MKQTMSFKNTYISFTPSFLGNGWETSLLPKIERGHSSEYQLHIPFTWLGKMFWKIQKMGKVMRIGSLTTVMARLFL